MVPDFFFFKQKTAYEMRISDWSSDVCSSDLTLVRSSNRVRGQEKKVDRLRSDLLEAEEELRFVKAYENAAVHWHVVDQLRSEEHTSELQSLMRISYAVFCLKKKTSKNTNIIIE